MLGLGGALSNERQGLPQQRMTDRHISSYWKICSFCGRRRKPDVFEGLKKNRLLQVSDD